jgi:hypothetical protein
MSVAMLNALHEGPIPRLDHLRRVPSRYQHILPLALMKHYQMLVVGAARGTLTVAITDSRSTATIFTLEKLTGRPIFTVLIEPSRMRILIERIERSHSWHYKRLLGRPYYLHRVKLRAMIGFLIKTVYPARLD